MSNPPSSELKSKGKVSAESILVNVEQASEILEKQEKEDVELSKKKQGKFYLPVLRINDVDSWESLPVEKRVHFTDKVAYNTCVGNCCGIPGLKAGCCHMDMEDLEHVLGPIDNKPGEHWIQDIVKWFRHKGVMVGRADIVIDFEEGKLIGTKFFDSHPVFFKEESYPILRFQVDGPRFVCKFLNTDSGKCTIYEKRPNMCRFYLCQHVKANFLVRSPDHPNTYIKVR